MLFHGLAFKPWRIWTRRPLWLKTLLGMLTGIGLGAGFSEQALLLKPIGVLFVNTIQMLMVPSSSARSSPASPRCSRARPSIGSPARPSASISAPPPSPSASA